MSINKNFANVFSLFVLFLGVIVALMIFFPAMAFQDADSSFTGIEIVFGTEFANLGNIVSGEIVPNLLGIFAYGLPLLACLVAVFVRKGEIIAVLLFTGGAVLLFLLPQYTTVTVTILNNSTEINVDWTISTGLIIAAIASSLGIMAELYQLVATTDHKA
jgi:hypothetical protein